MTRRRAYLLMAVHVSCAALTYVLGKWAAEAFSDPAALTFARSTGAAVLLLALTGTAIPRPDFERREWLGIIGLGVLLVAANQYPFLRGLEDTVPSHPALIYAMTPVLVLVISCALRRRLPDALRSFGVLAALAGVVVLLRPWEAGPEVAELQRGDLWICGALVMWAVYTVVASTLVRKHDARVVTAWSLIAGAVVFAPIGMPAFLALDLAAIPLRGWIGLVWMSCVTSALMMLIWNSVLAHLGPVEVAVCANGQPVATVALAALLASLGWLDSDQDLGPIFWIGALLVLSGVTLVQLRGASRVRAGTSPGDPARTPAP